MTKKPLLICLLMIMVIFLLSACSVRHRVSNTASREYSKEVLTIDNIEKVQIYFLRPSVHIDVYISEELNADNEKLLLELTKEYVIVENMEVIARAVGWNDVIWSAVLEIRSVKEDLRLKVYEADYFKTTHADDHPEENIDAYKTWKEW